MGITKLSVRRPLTMLMLILALAILGWRGFTLLKVDRFPPVDFPFVSVVTVYPGASPQDVEKQVVKPIEDAVAGIPGIDFIQSISNESVGFVVIAFLEGVDGNQAAIDVERQVATIKGTLPDDALEPSIVKADFNAIPIMNIILSGSQSQDELFKIADNQIKPSLQSIKGVASVSVAGGRDRIIAVKLDANKLTAFNLPISSLNQTFALNNLTFPIGTLEEGRVKTNIRAEGSFQSLAGIENMVIAGGPSPFGGGGGGRPAPEGSDTGGLVYVRDVATVEDTFADTSILQRYNGQDTVVISVVKASDANVIEVADTIRERLDGLNASLPGGAKAVIVSDDSNFIKNSVKSVEEDLILAILVTGLVMLMFLHTIRSTFIVLLAIPTSLLSTFLVMWILGYTLNVLTLLALTLTIGILVDDSIVVLENIERHLRMKKAPKQAAIEGRAEIGGAAIAITLVDVVVYVPVAFTSGVIGQFFRSYGITIVVATLFSLFMSFTLTPMLAAYWLKDERPGMETVSAGLGKFLGTLFKPVVWLWDKFTAGWDKGFNFLANLYARVIKLTLTNGWTQFITLVIAFALLGAAFLLAPVIGFEFAPQEDDGQFTVSIEMPPATNLLATDSVARQIEQIVLREVPETTSILTRVGGGASSASIFSDSIGGGNTASVFVQVVNKNDRERKLTEIVDSLRPVVSQIPDAIISVDTAGLVGGMETGVSLQVYGPDPDVLVTLANQVAEIVRTTPNTTDVVNNDAVRAPETKIKLDRTRLADLGLSVAQVSGDLRTAVTGGNIGDYAPDGGEKVNIILRLDENSRQDLAKVLQLPVGYISGKPVLLGQVAEIERTFAPSVINRYNRQRILTISSGVIGTNAGGIANDVEARIKKEVTFPPEYGYRFSGATEEQRQSFGQLGSAIGLSVILIYMLLVALYQDILQPLAIMFTLPMALIGVLVGLVLSHNSLNIFSLLGVIVLFGVVTRNAILIVDFANQLREQGLSRKEALVEAGRLRLRPIAMTASTLVFALLPVLLSTADGSESRTPIAAVMVGGAITGGLMALVVTPVLYNILDALSNGIKTLFNWLSGKKSAETPSKAA